MQILTLTETQAEIVDLVSKKGEVSIDDFRDRIDDVRILLVTGHLRLKVEVNEWGISFDLVSRKAQQN